jgi:organic radical activating enzyme
MRSVIITQLCATVQGEGPGAGIPNILLRLGNCNLNCDFCDTKWTNHLKADLIPGLGYKRESELPFRLLEDDIPMFVNYIKQKHIKDYDIHSMLITGGEPLMYKEFLYKLVDEIGFDTQIMNFEIETNGTLFTDDMIEKINMSQYRFQFNVSPKLDYNAYASEKIKSLDDIIELFESKNQIISQFMRKYPFSKTAAQYKFVYSKADESKIDKFINSIDITIPIYIMPLTPDYTEYQDEYIFLQDYRQSCYDAVDYCLRRNYVFSPRIHIWVFNNFTHRNEFEDVKMP